MRGAWHGHAALGVECEGRGEVALADDCALAVTPGQHLVMLLHQEVGLIIH
jgi:hypothetical protein